MVKKRREFAFTVLAQHKYLPARAGKFRTPHGVVRTPVYMPVGTLGSVKAVSPEDLNELGAQIVLGNTYHLYLRPGQKTLKSIGGLHEFMRWDGPILTDSGGYQVSSLGNFRNAGYKKLSKIDEEGVTFTSHFDGSRHRFTPEKSIEIQHDIGADIIMAFDEATPFAGKKYARDAMNRTHKWLVRSITRWKELEETRRKGTSSQALFGIIQGGNYKDLRRESAKFVSSKLISGVAIGGASIGKSRDETERNVAWVYDLLPKDKPFYLMGVGVGPRDVISAVLNGADMFDCVAPTKIARTGYLYSGKLQADARGFKFKSEFMKSRLDIGKTRFNKDKLVIDKDCDCYTCKKGFSRAYLHHLFRSRELLYYRLASIHNLRFMVRLVEKLRKKIIEFRK